MKKKPLGRGLEALIPRSESKKEIFQLNIDEIVPNCEQPRKSYDEESLTELAESIKEHGIIQPIIVTKVDNKYKIIAGERRFRAAKKINLKQIPAIIKNIDRDGKILELSLIENIQREDLNTVDLARAYKFLINRCSYTQEELSKVIGKSRSSIANTLRLLKLPQEVLEGLKNNKITEGHARTLLALEEQNYIRDVYKKILDNNLSVRETEQLIKKLKNKNSKKIKSENPFKPFINDLEKQLENFFNTKVVISGRETKGSIKITYNSKKELEQIISKLRGERC
ncbi:MAG: ParB/RepB/Spo0J family partition protein [Deferribacterota bacterium]|nr:ParB/RepB/Spo0J family partition protein [Deferribacterota bacterium]